MLTASHPHIHLPIHLITSYTAPTALNSFTLILQRPQPRRNMAL